MAYPSHIARDALRRALRTHPQAETVLQGRKVSSLPLGELYKLLKTLGVDANAIVDATLRGETPTPSLEVPCDNLPQETPQEVMDRFNKKFGGENTSEPDAIEAEVQTIRGLIVTGGFSALDDRLRELVTEARKPPVEIRVEVPVDVVPGAPVHISKLTGKTATWRALFDVRGVMGKRDCQVWDGTHPNTPPNNDRYLWPQPETSTALSQIARGRNVMLFGPPGTGKTDWARQLAAKTGRPFALISCDNGTDAATLVGMTVPDAAGGVTWQDGQLTRAIRTPGCVVCIDEPSVARPGALFVLQNVLADRVLFVAETGARIPVAGGVVFIATDNTNGTGGGARHGFTDTNRLNAAFLDRFGVRVKFNYLSADREASAIAGYTGCTLELAQLLVRTAAVTRAAADNQTLSQGIGLRRLLSWAELLTDGVDPETAFHAAVLDCASEGDVETLREQCLLSYDHHTVSAALNPIMPGAPDPTVTNPTPAGRSAATDFSDAV